MDMIIKGIYTYINSIYIYIYTYKLRFNNKIYKKIIDKDINIHIYIIIIDIKLIYIIKYKIVSYIKYKDLLYNYF